MLFFCRHRTLSDQGLSCSVKKDQSADKHFSSDDVRISIVNFSRSQSMPSLVESKVVFAEADSCYNPDHINPVEKKVHISSAMVSNQRRTRYPKKIFDRCDELKRMNKLLCAEIQAIETKLVESRTRSFKSGSKRKTKNKHEETMGQDRLDGTKRSSKQE